MKGEYMKKQALLMLLATLASPIGAEQSEDKKGWLEVSRAGNLVTIEVYSKFEENVSGSYTLEAKKQGPSGTSISRQGGKIPSTTDNVLGPLAVSRISLETAGILEISLVVTDTNGQTFEDTHIVK